MQIISIQRMNIIVDEKESPRRRATTTERIQSKKKHCKNTN